MKYLVGILVVAVLAGCVGEEKPKPQTSSTGLLRHENIDLVAFARTVPKEPKNILAVFTLLGTKSMAAWPLEEVNSNRSHPMRSILLAAVLGHKGMCNEAWAWMLASNEQWLIWEKSHPKDKRVIFIMTELITATDETNPFWPASLFKICPSKEMFDRFYPDAT